MFAVISGLASSLGIWIMFVEYFFFFLRFKDGREIRQKKKKIPRKH